jgi:cell division protein FtsW
MKLIQEGLETLSELRTYYDGFLAIASISILIIGFVMVTSASLHLGDKMVSNPFHYPLRQLIHICLGLGVGAFILTINMGFWEKSGQWLFLLGLILLVMVLIPGVGVKVNGSIRWIQLIGFRVQVSEIVKLFSVIYMAGYVTRHQEVVKVSAYGIVKPLMLFSLACFLLLLEPDFGSAVVILTIAMGVMFLGGARLWQFMILGVLLVSLAALLCYFSEYRWARITSFIDPWADPLDKGFQLVQALIAFGQGEWLGVGLGSSIQKLFYLPEAHTDFLFSVIAEELGLVGVVSVIGLFTVFIWRAFVIGEKAEKAGYLFSAFIAYGLAIWFGFQAFVNIGVNMGVLPTKGLTLPLMSYGGGSMIVMCAGVALLFRINMETEKITSSIPKGKREWINV